MADIVSNGYLKDKNGQIMEIVDQTARTVGTQNAGELETVKADVSRLSEEIANAGGSGGLTIINLTYDSTTDTFASDLTRNEIKALVAEGKQCVFHDGGFYSSIIDYFGNAVIRTRNVGNSVGMSTYYYYITVGAWDTSVTLKPIVNTPYVLMDNLVYKLSVGTDGAVTATQVTDGGTIGN